MSRAGYSEDMDDGNWGFICWRGAVNSAIKGRRGQTFLKDLLAALDALPEKKLISDELEKGGAVCALGAVGKKRGINMKDIDAYDHNSVAPAFDIAGALAHEIMYENDEGNSYNETPEQRFERMRKWVVASILPEAERK